MIEHTVPVSVGTEELSAYLRRAWPLLPGHVLRDLLKKKDVRVNGKRCGKGDKLRGGDILNIYADDRHFAPPAQVLFDDGHLVVMVKPQGLPCVPDRDGVGADTMETRLKRLYPDAQLCHRLDTGTGGVIIAAVDQYTYERAFITFKNHNIRKLYSAILIRKPPKPSMTLRSYLIKDAKHSEVRVCDKPRPEAKEVVTKLQTVKDMADGVVRVQLEACTGRTHQLRAHTAHIGCPILGDDKYGDREINKRLGFAGKLCLWCESMTILKDSPLEQYAGMTWRADPPEWR